MQRSSNKHKNLSHSVDQPMEIKEPHGGWEKIWAEGRTLWDLGEANPVVTHLSKAGSLPNGRVLVPGCGTGYEVVVMANPERHVVGLDVSKTSVERSTKMFSSLPNSKHFTFLKEDFFTWEPTEKFDLILDYNFFCAFEPKVRPLWAKRMQELLNPGGELLTMIFPLNDRVGGPPYQVSVSQYEELLFPLGFEVISIWDNRTCGRVTQGSGKSWKMEEEVIVMISHYHHTISWLSIHQ